MKSSNFLFTNRTKTVFILSVFLIFFSSSQVSSQEPEIEKIIQEVSVDSQKGAILNYAYLMKFSYDQHRFGGRKFTRLYEAILPSRYALNRNLSHPMILLQDSERLIPEAEVLEIRKNIARQLERLENADAAQQQNPGKKIEPRDDGGYWTINFSANSHKVKVDVLQLLKNSLLGNLQRRQIEGRNTVLIDFSPNPNGVFEKSLSYLSKLEGQIWIDETDKRIIRVEGYAPGAFGVSRDKPDLERRREMIFLFLQTKVPEGFWFPHTVRLNFAGHPKIFETFEIEFSFSNYKKSAVDVQFQEDSQKTTGSQSEKN